MVISRALARRRIDLEARCVIVELFLIFPVSRRIRG